MFVYGGGGLWIVTFPLWSDFKYQPSKHLNSYTELLLVLPEKSRKLKFGQSCEFTHTTGYVRGCIPKVTSRLSLVLLMSNHKHHPHSTYCPIKDFTRPENYKQSGDPIFSRVLITWGEVNGFGNNKRPQGRPALGVNMIKDLLFFEHYCGDDNGDDDEINSPSKWASAFETMQWIHKLRFMSTSGFFTAMVAHEYCSLKPQIIQMEAWFWNSKTQWLRN